MKLPLTILIDGKWMLYRALNVQTVLSHNDMNTSMYYYLLSSIKSVCKKMQPDNVIILWDSNKSLRKKIFPEYKRKNKEMDDNLKNQLQMIHDQYNSIRMFMKKLGFASFNRLGLEADDLFALYCEQNRDIQQICIVSRDEDLYQLLHENVFIFNPKEKKTKDKKWFIKNYGIEPEQWALSKAISGCSSDAIPGLKGVGESTALKYIRNELKKKDTIDSQWEKVEFYLKLTKLPFQNVQERPCLKLNKKYTNLNRDLFIELCQKLGFNTFLNNLDDWNILKRN